MAARVAILVGIAALWHSAGVRAEEQAHPLPDSAEIAWSDSISTPAICLGKNRWLVSVVPSAIQARRSDRVVLSFADQQYESTVLFLHPDLRLCLIEAPRGLKGIRKTPLGDLEAPDPGTLLYCCTVNSRCRTTIAGKDRSYRGVSFPVPLLRVRIDESGHFCKTGTPLISSDGNLEGILVERTTRNQGVAHAIPVSQLHKLLHDYAHYKKSGDVWIGIVFDNMSTTPEVLEVRDDSPAKEAGVRVGDVILSVNDVETESLADLAEAVFSLPAGQKSTMEVLRGLEKTSLELVPRFAPEVTTNP